MSETPKLELAITTRRDPRYRAVILEGRLNVYVNRYVDDIVLDSVGPDRVMQHECERMQREVTRFLTKQLPEELKHRIRYALRGNPYRSHVEFQTLTDELNRAWGFEVEAKYVGEDRRDQRIQELERILERGRSISRIQEAQIAGLENRLRHEQLRGRLFKKGKKNVRGK